MISDNIQIHLKFIFSHQAKNSLDEYQKLGYEAAQAQIKDRDTKIAVGQMWRMNRAVIGAIRGLRDKNDQFYHSVNKMYGRNGHLETLLKVKLNTF